MPTKLVKHPGRDREDEDDIEAGKPFEMELPAEWAICGACRGNGTELVEGLKGADVTEDLREDPDFAEDYWGGKYDTHCSCCHGTGKVLEVVEDRLNPVQKAFLEEVYEYQSEAARDRANDRYTRWMESGGYE